MDSARVRRRLARARDHDRLVAVDLRGGRRVEGAVLSLTRDWLVVALVDTDAAATDGFGVYRVEQVRRVRRLRHADVLGATLVADGRWPLRFPRPTTDLVVLDPADALRVALRVRPLVEVEVFGRPGFRVGVPVRCGRRTLRLLLVHPDTEWDLQPVAVRLRDVRAVRSGGRYALALERLAGPPPLRGLA